MPQIKPQSLPKYLMWLQKMGVSVSPGTVMVGSLSPTQKEINPDKVSELKGKGFLTITPILISYDNYVLDGHHRWAALFDTSPSKVIPVIKLGLPIKELLEITHSFGNIEYVDLQDQKVASETQQLTWKWLLASSWS